MTLVFELILKLIFRKSGLPAAVLCNAHKACDRANSRSLVPLPGVVVGDCTGSP